MESGKFISWRRIGFKLSQLLITGQALFGFLRTLEYVSCGDAGFFGEVSNRAEDLFWDFVPFMFMGIVGYSIFEGYGYFMFDVGRELNSKVFNEFIRLWGKTSQRITSFR